MEWAREGNLDAFSVCVAAGAGFFFSVFDVPVLIPASVIGAAFSAIGVFLGRGIGKAVGKWAERLGGAVLIGIGIKIFIERLTRG
jgi:manganese efflux pump family protein